MSEFYVNPNPRPGQGTAFADVEVHFPAPVKKIILASDNGVGSLYVHTSPLGKVAVANAIPVTGREKWLNMIQFPVITYKCPLRSLFFTGDGSPPDFTIIGTTDIEDLEVEQSGNPTAPIIQSPRKNTIIETTTPLLNGATFTGAWHDSELDGAAYVTVTSFSTGGANGSISIQESDDITNANFTRTIFGSGTIGNAVIGRAGAPIRARYWRVLYTVSVANQATFELTSCALSFQNGYPDPSFSGLPTIPTIAAGTLQAGGGAFADDGADATYSAALIGISSQNATGALRVMSPIFGGAFSGTPQAALQGWSKPRTSTIFRRVTTQATGSTALWTPGGANKFRLLGYVLEVTSNAAAAAAAVLTIKLLDSATDINIDHQVFIPAAAGTTFGTPYVIRVALGALGILSAAANNVLNLNLSFALTAGQVNVIAYGTEE